MDCTFGRLSSGLFSLVENKNLRTENFVNHEIYQIVYLNNNFRYFIARKIDFLVFGTFLKTDPQLLYEVNVQVFCYLPWLFIPVFNIPHVNGPFGRNWVEIRFIC